MLNSERLGPVPSFSLSSLTDTYMTNGEVLQRAVLPRVQEMAWEVYNSLRLTGKGWIAGQAVFITGSGLIVFGRDPAAVDVVPSSEIDAIWRTNSDLRVSRTHFQIREAERGQLLFTDPGSTNGSTIYPSRRESFEIGGSTRGRSNEYPLVERDIVVFGYLLRGVTSRLFGFRVLRNPDTGILYLAKFIAPLEAGASDQDMRNAADKGFERIPI